MKINIGKYSNNGITASSIDTRSIQIKIDSSDTWNMDHTLSYIIFCLLMQYRKDAIGVPPAIYDQLDNNRPVGQRAFDFYDNEEATNLIDKLAAEQWKQDIDKMIWSFFEIMNNQWLEHYIHDEEKNPKYIEFVNNNPPTPDTIISDSLDGSSLKYWIDSVGQQLHEDRIKEGLELFAKYYMNLWE